MKNNHEKERTYQLTISGKEHSDEEIVWDNLLAYMTEKGMSAEAQVNYLKNKILYLQYYKNVHKGLRHFVIMASVATSAIIAGAYYFDYGNIRNLALSAVFMMSGKIVYTLSRNNPYKEALTENSDVHEKEETYRKIAPFM